jgi:1-acyl-sn-glycerol-3-phosphate acyltransferase
MQASEFQDRLRTAGGYESPVSSVLSSRSRRAALASTRFYLRLWSIIVRAWFTARSGRYGSVAWTRDSYSILRTIEYCGGRLCIAGAEGMVRTPGAKVYVSNHMSALETLILPSILLSAGPATFVIKTSLMRYPFFGGVLRALDPVCVNRSSARDDLRTVLSEGEKKCRAGISVVLFPQATRSLDFDPSAFNTLGAKLAARAGVSLVPVAVKTDFMGIGRIMRDFGRISPDRTVRVAFGPPIDAATAPRDAHRQAVEFIVGALTGWGVSVHAPQA